MQVYGAADGPFVAPITFQLFFSRINHELTTGSYHPAINGSTDFIGFVLHFDTTGNLSASADLPAFTIFVTTYNDTTRLVEGNFAGPVIDEFGQTHTITNGAFRTYFKKQWFNMQLLPKMIPQGNMQTGRVNKIPLFCWLNNQNNFYESIFKISSGNIDFNFIFI